MRRSNVTFLPPKLRQEVEQIWREGTHTNEELWAFINSKVSANGRGRKISRTGLNAYLRRLKAQMDRYDEAQQIAAVWIKKLGREPEGNTGRLLIEMLRMVAFRQLADMGDAKARRSAKPSEIAVIARAIKEMESASSVIADRAVKLREKLRDDVERKADRMKQGASAAPGDLATLERAKELVRGLL